MGSLGWLEFKQRIKTKQRDADKLSRQYVLIQPIRMEQNK